MRKIVTFFLSLIILTSCSKNREETLVTLKFTHNWNGTPITNQDFNNLKFTNENGEKVSIERLRYLVSNISLINSKNYNLVDVGENSGNLIAISMPPGDYNLSFTFGFTDEDNKDGVYQDLNSVNFNVPAMMGGGYHYMQFDGKYINSNNQEAPFNYHAIRAIDRSNPQNIITKDTSFPVDLGMIKITNDTTIEIQMNVAKWFSNKWNLNTWDTPLMPNYNAQIQMNTNGKSVFSIKK